MRTGAELVRASQVYAKEDEGRTWRELAATVAAWVATLAFLFWAPLWPMKLAASVVIGLLIVRFFIFYHDYQHGAVFRSSTLGRWCMHAVGLYTLAAPTVWKETHDYHHRNNAKLLGSAIGSYPLVTVGIWKGLQTRQRIGYRVIRHPLMIAFGWITAFMLGMCLAPFRRAPKVHWQGPYTLFIYALVATAVWWNLGWAYLAYLVVIPGLVSSASGAYLFYAQHNFPGAEMRGRREWDFTHAALRCSSFFEMSAIMHWFTGNIGYHHVHHLNHRIPFYRLPEAMAGMPELQDPIRTSWHPRDVWGCLRIGLWEPATQKMISLREGARLIEAEAKLAAK